MVECGKIEEPPSVQNITVWGIVTFVIMAVLGISSIYGVIDACNFGDLLYSLLLLVGSAFGVAGLILVIFSIVQHNGAYMKTGIFCFLISCLVHIVLLIFYIIRGDSVNEGSILQIALDIFLCYLFYRQSGGFTPNPSDTPGTTDTS